MSFMKPIAGPLAGAAVSMIPGGAAFAPLVSSAVGGALQSSPNSSALSPMTQGMQTGYNLANQMAGMAGQSYSPVIDYYSRLLSNNRSMAMSALAPEISRMADQNAAAMRAASTLMPRGGPSASFMGQLPFQNTAAVQSLFQGLRPMAAQGLGQVASNLMSNSLNALNTGTAAGRSIMDYQLQKSVYDRALGASMGGAAADAFKNLDFSKLLNLGRKPTGPGPGISVTPGVDYSKLPSWTPPTFGGPLAGTDVLGPTNTMSQPFLGVK